MLLRSAIRARANLAISCGVAGSIHALFHRKALPRVQDNASQKFFVDLHECHEERGNSFGQGSRAVSPRRRSRDPSRFRRCSGKQEHSDPQSDYDKAAGIGLTGVESRIQQRRGGNSRTCKTQPAPQRPLTQRPNTSHVFRLCSPPREYELGPSRSSQQPEALKPQASLEK